MICTFDYFCSTIYEHTNLLKPLCNIIGGYAHEEYDPKYVNPLLLPGRVNDIINQYAAEQLSNNGSAPSILSNANVLSYYHPPENDIRTWVEACNFSLKVEIRKNVLASITEIIANYAPKIKSIALLSPPESLISALSSHAITVIHCDPCSFGIYSRQYSKVTHVLYDISLPFRMIETLRCNAKKEDKLLVDNPFKSLPFVRIFSKLKFDQEFDCIISFVSVVKIAHVFCHYYKDRPGSRFPQSMFVALQTVLMRNISHLAKYILTAEFTNPELLEETMHADAFEPLKDEFDVLECRKVEDPGVLKRQKRRDMEVRLYGRKPSNDRGDAKSNQ